VFLSYANFRFRWGNISVSAPSRFIKEIDPCFLEFAGDKTAGFTNHSFSSKPSFDFGDRKMIRHKEDRSIKAGFGSSGDSEKIKPGMTVEHSRFGCGKVLSVDGFGDNAKVTVHFGSAGQKQLLVKFAKLKVVG